MTFPRCLTAADPLSGSRAPCSTHVCSISHTAIRNTSSSILDSDQVTRCLRLHELQMPSSSLGAFNSETYSFHLTNFSNCSFRAVQFSSTVLNRVTQKGERGSMQNFRETSLLWLKTQPDPQLEDDMQILQLDWLLQSQHKAQIVSELTNKSYIPDTGMQQMVQGKVRGEMPDRKPVPLTMLHGSGFPALHSLPKISFHHSSVS